MPADKGDPVSLNQGKNSSSQVSENWGQQKRLRGLAIIEHRAEEKAMDWRKNWGICLPGTSKLGR